MLKNNCRKYLMQCIYNFKYICVICVTSMGGLDLHIMDLISKPSTTDTRMDVLSKLLSSYVSYIS